MQTAGNMLTTDDVAAIPLFSTLPPTDLERLARTSADLQLSSGEFAVHEGGEGALFVVLNGNRWRAGRPCRGRLRCIRRVAHDRCRTRGAGGQAGTSSRIENYLG